MRWASANSRFFSGTNSVNVRCPLPASGVSASEEVTLPAIPGNRSRDRNIHPRGRETIGDRRNYSVSALFLPVAHAVAQAIFFPFTPSISFRLLFPVAYLPFILLPSIFFFFHWHGRDTYTSPFRIPHMRRINPPISFYPSLSLFLLPTSTLLYALLDTQDALPLDGHLRPLPSSGSFLLVPSHLRAIRRGGAPDGSRGNTAYRRSYSAQSF